jgi:hypothetical protein
VCVTRDVRQRGEAAPLTQTRILIRRSLRSVAGVTGLRQHSRAEHNADDVITLTSGCRCVNYSDPFGLCPGETSRQASANRTQSNTEHCTPPKSALAFAGVTANGYVGVGGTVAAGVWKTRTQSGPYLHLGGGFGLDVAAGEEAGGSGNRDAFRGHSTMIVCGGVLSYGGCVGGNKDGLTGSGGETVGTRDLPIPVSIHVEPANTTFAPTWGETLASPDRSFECAKVGMGC